MFNKNKKPNESCSAYQKLKDKACVVTNKNTETKQRDNKDSKWSKSDRQP
jgi:hypothetical protein